MPEKYELFRDKKIRQKIKQAAEEKADRLLYLDPLKLERNLHVYLYNFAIKILKEYGK